MVLQKWTELGKSGFFILRKHSDAVIQSCVGSGSVASVGIAFGVHEGRSERRGNCRRVSAMLLRHAAAHSEFIEKYTAVEI